ncbi:acyl-CoA thioesterase [Nocardioides sp. MAHUQ-72]|uniref:acyl-CoA thioesterase n=1 Tax=unclassified Nocardioides TaxID=2615069 RepID=UPI0036237F8C
MALCRRRIEGDDVGSVTVEAPVEVDAVGTRATTVAVAVRYDDLGASGHVNNVAAVRIIEEARRTFLGRPATPGAAGGVLDLVPEHVRHFVRRQDVEYRAELWYQAAPFLVAMEVIAVGRTSVRMRSEIRTSATTRPAVVAETVLVLADSSTGRTWPIPPDTAELLVAQPTAGGGRLLTRRGQR